MTVLTGKNVINHCHNLGISVENLTEFNIPDSVTEIDSWAFSACTSLQSITMPDSVTVIGGYAFLECTSLTSITIPDSVTKIGECAFGTCTSLTTITIPDSVTEISSRAFYGCTSLTQVICNNPDLFTDKNINNRDQIQFISTTEYFKENYKELLNSMKSSGFNTEYVSSQELDLIMKLHQKDYQPKWETIAKTFENRSMYQIKDMLHYFDKTQSIPKFFDTVSLGTNQTIYFNHLSMFLTPSEQKNLTDATKDATIKPKKSQSG